MEEELAPFSSPSNVSHAMNKKAPVNNNITVKWSEN